MWKTWACRLLGVIALSVFMGTAVRAADDTTRRLVSVEWLQKNLGTSDVLVLDASVAQQFAAKHIPGAVSADAFSFAARELTAEESSRRLQKWGLSPGKKVVIYDQGGTYMATSLFYDLYYQGFPVDDLFVLDGGLAKWQALGGAVTKDPTPAPMAGNFQVTSRKEEIRVRLPEFLVASGDPAGNALVEGLEPAYYYGSTKFFDRAGHVPNAIMLPAADVFNPDKTFKSPQEIRKLLDHLGIRPDQQVHTYCGGGIAASLPFFATKFLAEYPKVKLYKESQLEWLRDERGLPVWTYAAPHMTRGRDWLSGWGSPMMRAFGVAKLSVVDVRPEDIFKQGHVPFSLSIPAAEFKRTLGSPAKLAGLLGAAGVEPAHEAVIVSSGGLNPASALAYLLLEQLGQKKVSILLDSVDDWGFAGLTVAKEGTGPDGKPAAAKPAVVPTTYPANIRNGLLIADPKSTQGNYAKVYIAAGQALPARVPDGKVIHLPYTDLVASNGVPKPAKDLWSVLNKAGVSRYAEIICIADDPGEAAVNYFILKLMGFPDVKVLGAAPSPLQQDVPISR